MVRSKTYFRNTQFKTISLHFIKYKPHKNICYKGVDINEVDISCHVLICYEQLISKQMKLYFTLTKIKVKYRAWRILNRNPMENCQILQPHSVH